ncbi:MAG: hypothetical protein ACR2PT_01065 [Endozoicomonas sp.]
MNSRLKLILKIVAVIAMAMLAANLVDLDTTDVTGSAEERVQE